MRVESFPEAATPVALRRQVVALQDLAWPPDPPADRAPGDPPPPTHDPALDPVSVLLVDAGVVLAALDVLSATVHHGGVDWTARGLSTVVTDPAHRGEGLGLVLVRAAADLIARSGADLTVFTCDLPLADFYTAAGYAVLPGTVLVGGTREDPLRSDAPGFAKLALGAFHTGRARAARRAFDHAEIALYPGTVDRLW